MPQYKGKPCIGMCEAHLRTCYKTDLYVEVAERFGAEPFENTGTMVIDPYGPEKPWSQWALNVQGDKREDAITGIMKVMKLRDEKIEWNDDELRILVEKYWLPELPCHLECPITICGYCGLQHERYMIHDGTCDIATVLHRRSEEEE